MRRPSTSTRAKTSLSALQDVRGGEGQRRPFTASLPPERFAHLDDVRIDANRGVVDEHAIVNVADIDGGDVPRDDGFHRLAGSSGNVQVLGKMIQGPERQDARERCSCPLHAAATLLTVPSPPAATTVSPACVTAVADNGVGMRAGFERDGLDFHALGAERARKPLHVGFAAPPLVGFRMTVSKSPQPCRTCARLQ